MTVSSADAAKFTALWKGSLIPLHACLVGLVWIIHDYFITLEDEIRYIWPQKWSFGKFMFFWIRYYSIALLIFDVTQIHLFSRPGITNDNVCVVMDSMIRVVGAISLWSIEIIMMLRIYALYKCSMKVAIFNGVLFLGSIAGFSWVLIHNALRRHSVIADAIHYPLPGCPSIHSGIEWAQWIPATAFEGVLFLFVIFKTARSSAGRFRRGSRISLYELILRDNVLYFIGVSALLVFNNIMVVGTSKIPWFSYSPFHAALAILTTRMLLNIRKATATEINGTLSGTEMAHVGRSAEAALKDSQRAAQMSVGTWKAASVPNGRSFGSTTIGTVSVGGTGAPYYAPWAEENTMEKGINYGRDKPLPAIDISKERISEESSFLHIKK